MKKRIMAILVLFISVVSQAADQSVVNRYTRTCAVCHATGAAGAPKSGVVSDWQPRLEKGMDVLLQNVSRGTGAMPPKGLCMDCSNDEFNALIKYMATPK